MTPLARIHLDPVGGIAGDMFAAAMAHAFPGCVAGLMDELRKLRSPHPLQSGDIRFVPHTDTALSGLRFHVACQQTDAADRRPHIFGSGRVDPTHLHVPHARIQGQLHDASLQPAVLEHALGLFQTLAEAEAEVHQLSPDEVEFHEVGAWDSIVDFVAAAYFIATLAPERWTCAPVPLGSGRVNTAHGVLPVPAPATTLLLKGLAVIDDGVAGERVTPTGAAILRYLDRRNCLSAQRHAGQPALSVAATGNGFGTRTLPGLPNMLRVVAFAHAASAAPLHDEEIAAIAFEIDDQTAEDLAVALEHIRQAPGVLDVSQLAVYGKKNRLATQVQVLARMEAANTVADLCLEQTATLGVRISRVWRRTAPRAIVEAHVPDAVRVKVAERPSGAVSGKAEMDDVARIAAGRAEREDVRRRAEQRALETVRNDGKRRRGKD
jgi:uncharacterized protein (TIGR00299 family) protein